jgi:hypothetical protein
LTYANAICQPADFQGVTFDGFLRLDIK